MENLSLHNEDEMCIKIWHKTVKAAEKGNKTPRKWK